MAKQQVESSRAPMRRSSRPARLPLSLSQLQAYLIARDYTAPTVTIVKHTDPVGLASHDELVEAYRHVRL